VGTAVDNNIRVQGRPPLSEVYSNGIFRQVAHLIRFQDAKVIWVCW